MKSLFKRLTIMSIALTFLIVTPTHANSNDITILFTHDMHDNFEPYLTEVNGKIEERAGFARLYSAILKEKAIDNDALLIDGGDYSQGTLFQSIFATHSPTLRLLHKMGYDATTFGNHEFDFRPVGLSNSLNAVIDSNEERVDIIASNLNFDVKDKSEDLSNLEKAMDDYGVLDYKIVEKNNVKIGMFGLMGYEADSNAPMAEVEFLDMVESSKRVVKLLEAENVDMIVAISHSGTSSDPKTSEDELLAKAVSGIDVIVSGHSHTQLDEPIIVDNTTIVSSGSNANNLGKVVLSNNGSNWEMKDYQIIPIDNTLESNAEIQAEIEKYKEAVNDEYLSKYGLDFNEVIAKVPFSFTPSSQLTKSKEEEPLAHMLGDSYIYSIKEIEGSNYIPVDVAVVPSGVLRDSLTEGNITVSDAFKLLPLGVGKDGVSGYPILSVYLSGEELKLAAEIDASISPILSYAKLYLTGMSYTYNPNRMLLNKVTDVSIFDGLNKSEINDDQLYRVVADLYTAQMLSVVNDQSFGLLSITPKDIDGNTIEDFEDHIIYTEHNDELKAWVAASNYLRSFDKDDAGIPVVDMKYASKQGYKVIEEDNNIINLLKNPNKFALVFYAIILFIIILLILIIRFIIKLVRRKSNQKYRN